MARISEFARQLHEAILALGYSSPERTWQGYEILNELQIKNGKSYSWLAELEKEGLLIRIPSPSISTLDQFYVVRPAAGLVTTASNTAGHQAKRDSAAMAARTSVLSQDKAEHAVLWSLVRESYEDEFADARTVRSHLLNAVSEQQARAALIHLVECDLARHCSASTQEHYEPTRLGIQRIERLEKQKASFVGRLNIHGPKWLSSASAQEAELASQITKPTVPAPSPSAHAQAPGVVIHNQVAPIQTTHLSPPGQADGQTSLARSGVRAAWVNVGVAILIAIVVVFVTLYAANKWPFDVPAVKAR